MTMTTTSSQSQSSSSSDRMISLDALPKQAWEALPSMMSQREGGAAVAIPNNRVLVVGGYHVEEKFLKSCAVLDLNTNTWKSFPPMKTERMGCAAVFLEQHNAVVVVGGFQRGRKYLATAEYLDLTSQRWHRLPPMQIPRAGCAAVTVLGKRVVVLGGWKDGDTALREVEVLDFSAQQWHLLPEMTSPRAGCAAAALGHLVLVIGGHTTSGKARGCRSSVECLDLSTQRWSRFPSMKEKRDASACVVSGDNYVVVVGGGESSTAPLSSGELLDVSTKTWHSIPSMKNRRFGCSAAIVGNKVIVIGGRGDGHHLDSAESLTLPMMKETSAGGASGAGSDSLAKFLIKNELSTDSRSDELRSLMSASQDDKTRALQNYEANRSQANEIYDRTVSALNERLRVIEKERQKIKEHLAKAEKARDEALKQAEQEKAAALQKAEEVEHARSQASSNPNNLLDPHEPSAESDADDDPLDEPPPELCCCITGDLMDDPVTAMDGHTYERSAIEAWFARFETKTAPTSPMTNERLHSRRLIPSHNIRSQCQTWRQKLANKNGGETEIDPLAHLSSHLDAGNSSTRVSMSSLDDNNNFNSSSSLSYNQEGVRRERRHSLEGGASLLENHLNTGSAGGRRLERRTSRDSNSLMSSHTDGGPSISSANSRRRHSTSPRRPGRSPSNASQQQQPPVTRSNGARGHNRASRAIQAASMRRQMARSGSVGRIGSSSSSSNNNSTRRHSSSNLVVPTRLVSASSLGSNSNNNGGRRNTSSNHSSSNNNNNNSSSNNRRSSSQGRASSRRLNQ